MNHLLTMNLAAALLVASTTQLTSCPEDDDDVTPTPIPTTDCTGTYLLDAVNSYEQTGSYPDPWLEVACDDDFVVVRSNGIPNFEFTQVTPNALREQNFTWNIPRSPELAPAPTSIWVTGPVGISVTGLPFYAPNEAPNDGYGDPVLDGLLDYCNGHTDQAGAYHWHARPECLFETIDGKLHLVLGYAFDGFPIVSPFECTDKGCSKTEEVTSSYVYVGGSRNAYQANQYQAGHGDLDECNGMTAPDGQYRYYATDTFPYLIGCFSGTPESSNNPNGSGGDPGGEPTPTPGGSCTTNDQCANACPPGSMGCTCAPRPDGTSGCTPTCATDDDCPDGGPAVLTCDERAGLCVPEGAP